jgi:hypothetical protein
MAEITRQEGESLVDFMQRLAKTRAGGVLGGGGMFYEPPAATGDTTATIDVVNNAITSEPLGMLRTNTSSDTQVNGWDKVKTLEQRTAEAIDRQAQLTGPRAVDAFGLIAPSWMSAGAKYLEDVMDESTLGSYLDKTGFTDEYGEEARDAMAANPAAMLSLMSTGDMPAVGGYQRYDMADYKPQTWGDLGSRMYEEVKTGLGNLGSIVGGLFGGEYSATPSAAGQYQFDFTPRTGSIDMIGNTPINTMEDLYNLTTVGNSSQGFGNYNPNTGSYTIGTKANKNADGSYTIGTSYNKNDGGGYTIGTTEGSSPIAATNTTPDWYSAATGESWD